MSKLELIVPNISGSLIEGSSVYLVEVDDIIIEDMVQGSAKGCDRKLSSCKEFFSASSMKRVSFLNRSLIVLVPLVHVLSYNLF